jgi:DNA-binding transcriptional LysR family regulator
MNFRTLDLNLLRVFGAVMVERNVTRAATQLAMTQPAVSNALRRLREATGDELFVTVPSGVLPTARAELWWPEVSAALDNLRKVFDPQVFEPTLDERSFALAMTDAVATVLMPALVGALVGRQARSDLRVLPLVSRDPRPQLEHGSADIALGFFPAVAHELGAEGARAMTVLEPLYACEYVCVMRRDHPLADEAVLELDAYCAAEHVRVNFAGRPRGFVDEGLAALGRERRVVLMVNQFATAARVIHESDLLSVLPRSFVPASGFGAGLALRAVPIALPRIEVGMLWHRRHERDPAQRWLRSTVSEVGRSLAIGEPRGATTAPRQEAIADGT